MITFLATVFVFGLLVMVHELGHFITAKLTGMRVTDFAIGMGPKIVGWTKGETEYSIRAIPLGGYIKIAGMDPEEEQDERSYGSKPIWAKAVVIAAGSIMNFVLPVLLFTIVFFSRGIDTVSEQPVIGGLIPSRPAIQAGLNVGDRVVSVNGVTVSTWRDVVEQIRGSKEQPVLLNIRDKAGNERNLKIPTETDPKSGRAIIGITPVVDHKSPGIFESLSLAVKQTYDVAGMMLSGLYQMITGKTDADLAGPIGVAQMAGQVAQLGFIPLLQFAAFLSINLGLINLLPIPILDGGHLLNLLIEAIRRKPLDKDQMRYTQMAGMAFLVLIMLLATYKDITRIFN